MIQGCELRKIIQPWSNNQVIRAELVSFFPCAQLPPRIDWYSNKPSIGNKYTGACHSCWLLSSFSHLIQSCKKLAILASTDFTAAKKSYLQLGLYQRQINSHCYYAAFIGKKMPHEISNHMTLFLFSVIRAL